ncbi:MAG: dihydrodipicolinate synthase family protein [Candidatus Poribacteria bacterium]|nr:dihydrodipicolinate synthase family protein [Candidatus Poribacteria bacterium]
MGKKNLDRHACQNVLVVAITPRRENREVDLEGMRQNVRYLIAHGVDFIMPMCGTGLVYDASLEEYEAVVGAFIDAAGDEAYIVPGLGPGFGRAIEMGHISRSLGVAGVMIMPVVGPASAKGVYNGLKAITEKVQLPTVLYQRRLDIMPVDDVVRLCELDAVVALKYAVEDLDAFDAIVEKAGDGAAMVCGMAEDPCIAYMEHGAIGFSSGMANFVPRMSLALRRNFAAGDKAEAERLRALMLPFEDLRGENGARYSSSALHAAMDYAGLAGGPVIPFAQDVAAHDRPRVHAMIDLLMKEEKALGN